MFFFVTVFDLGCIDCSLKDGGRVCNSMMVVILFITHTTTTTQMCAAPPDQRVCFQTTPNKSVCCDGWMGERDCLNGQIYCKRCNSGSFDDIIVAGRPTGCFDVVIVLVLLLSSCCCCYRMFVCYINKLLYSRVLE